MHSTIVFLQSHTQLHRVKSKRDRERKNRIRQKQKSFENPLFLFSFCLQMRPANTRCDDGDDYNNARTTYRAEEKKNEIERRKKEKPDFCRRCQWLMLLSVSSVIRTQKLNGNSSVRIENEKKIDFSARRNFIFGAFFFFLAHSQEFFSYQRPNSPSSHIDSNKSFPFRLWRLLFRLGKWCMNECA